MSHPSEELLLAVASGGADLAHRVLVEGHLASCPECRGAVGAFARPGGQLLETLAEEPVPAELWQRLAARLENEPPADAHSPDALAGLPLPEAARRELPDEIRRRIPRWRSAWTAGGRLAVLSADRDTGALLLIGHMGPGRSFPRHWHPGREDVLVLAGGYADHLGTYEAGVFASYAPGSEHRPVTEPDEECWVLFRLEKPVRFRGWRGWLQSLLGRF